MIQFLKKAQFATCLGVQNAYVIVNIKRGKIKINNEGMVDLNNPSTKIFIENHIAQGKTFDINRAYQRQETILTEIKEKKPQKNVETIENIEEIKEKDIEIQDKSTKFSKKQSKKTLENSESDDYIGLPAEKMRLEVEKLRLHNEIETLKKQKIEGLLIPVDAIHNIFIWSIDTFHNTYQQECNNLANLYSSIVGVDSGKLSKLIKELHSNLNRIKEEAKNNLLSGIDGIIEEYQEVRGRGERK